MLAAGTRRRGRRPSRRWRCLLSRRYSTWQEVGLRASYLWQWWALRPSLLDSARARLECWAFLGREDEVQHAASSPDCAAGSRGSLLALAEAFGFESVFGAFAAGMIVGQSTRGAEAAPLREKLDAVAFGWFFPFFFVGAGIHFDFAALAKDSTTALTVPLFAVLFLLVRGSPSLLYRRTSPSRSICRSRCCRQCRPSRSSSSSPRSASRRAT